MEPPTLTVTPPSAPPPDAVGLGHRGAGDALFLTSVVRSGGAVTFSLAHFSGRTVVTGTPAERTTQAGQLPASPEDAAEQRISALVERGRASGQFPTPEQLEPLFRDWFNGSVRPGLEAALTDDSRLMCAAAEFTRWDRERTLLGCGAKLTRERDWAVQTVEKAFVFAFDESSRRCVTGHDPRETSVMLSLSRQAMLLGHDSRIADPAYGIAKAERCARFKVRFESKIDWLIPNSGGGVGHYTWTSAETPVRASAETGLFMYMPSQATATDAVVYEGPNGTNASTYPAVYKISFFKGRFDRTLQCGSAPADPPFEIELDYETLGVDQSTGWFGFFSMAHPSIGLARFEAKDFVPGTGGVFAQRIYSSSPPPPAGAGGTVSEQTTITVTHDPI
jgi:hypothetical protein